MNCNSITKNHGVYFACNRPKKHKGKHGFLVEWTTVEEITRLKND